ncbi:hypothetical protein [Salinicola sp. MH3R3-1]|uniref:hypothetical protein n=1 Tax=Salinicola sp. MH3R3-1 TaxID=1928762 RepID=UPI00111527D9|nr:hypothetical protein [Salinicola sp. MH3R3-1]
MSFLFTRILSTHHFIHASFHLRTEVGGVMQDNIINAHRLIGETIHEPETERRGRIVGVDQSRAVPVIFVIWQEQSGIQRFELTRDELRQLAEACGRARSTGHGTKAERKSNDTGASLEDATFVSPELNQRRVGSR